MTESDARSVLLVRAFETTPGPAWTADDAAWAGDEARRVVGEQAPFDDWLAQRARLAAARIAERNKVLHAWLQAPSATMAWVARACVLVAFLAGVASDAVGAQRINILAPPLLVLLLWNVAVYALLLLHAVLARRPTAAPTGRSRQTLLRFVQRRLAPALEGEQADAAEPLARFARDWATAGRALWGARVAAVLHAAAAALVLGALASMYLRGLAFEYRAGWESTFLGAAQVHAIVSFVLGPAAHLSGLAIPGVEELAALRSPGPGANAASWIHLYAITLAWVVLVPRAALVLAAAWKAGRLARRFPLSTDDSYFRRLRLDWSRQQVRVRVVPYSYTLDAPRRAALRTTLERVVAPGVELDLADPVPLGGEDEPDSWRGDPAGIRVALFALTATPERDHHPRFLRALEVGAAGGEERVRVLIDEAGFRQRFAGSDLERRLAQRRSAWESMLRADGFEPIFVDLDRGSAP